MPVSLTDMVVVLPGIMGSVLEDADGDPLWEPGFGMAKKLFGHKRWVRALTVGSPDDPGDTAPLDGVRPVGLVDSLTIIPGLKRIDGYTELHDTLARTFTLIEGDQHRPGAPLDPSATDPPNYYRFGYDWRRDNRASAMQLAALVDQGLAAWRQVSPNAKAILIAHSMGGLVARWYLEGVDPATGDPIEGWRNVRELITFGTPYRGSLNALGNLVDGYRQLFIDFSDALRSFTSIYQLLPRYPSVHDLRGGADQWLYPKDLLGVADYDATRATEAYDGFHAVIDTGVSRHRSLPEYDPRFVSPIIGYGHDTENSALIDDDGLTLRDDLPTGVVPAAWIGGDGTVPYVSALPLEYDGWDRPAPTVFVNKKHGSMQSDGGVLAAEITNALAQTQLSGSGARGMPEEPPDRQADLVVGGPQMGLNLPDYVLAGQPIEGTITIANTDDAGPVDLEIVDAGSGVHQLSLIVEPEPIASVEIDLPPGEYRVEATSRQPVPGLGRLSSSDGLAVIDPSADRDE